LSQVFFLPWYIGLRCYFQIHSVFLNLKSLQLVLQARFNILQILQNSV
jgi:hypothetical protein